MLINVLVFIQMPRQRSSALSIHAALSVFFFNDLQQQNVGFHKKQTIVNPAFLLPSSLTPLSRQKFSLPDRWRRTKEQFCFNFFLKLCENTMTWCQFHLPFFFVNKTSGVASPLLAICKKCRTTTFEFLINVFCKVSQRWKKSPQVPWKPRPTTHLPWARFTSFVRRLLSTETCAFCSVSSNVLDVLDSHCSGRVSCTFPVNNFVTMNVRPCPKDVTSYLEVSYRCLPGEKLQPFLQVLKDLMLLYTVSVLAAGLGWEQNDDNKDDANRTHAEHGQTRALISVEAACVSKQVLFPIFSTRCSPGHIGWFQIQYFVRFTE